MSDIHIVWLTPDGDKVLDRLARLLAEGAGWTLSDRPREGVALNYAMVYVDFAQRFSDWRKTPWAAYFSHFEPDTPYKKFWWEMAIPLVDVKTVTADQYGKLLSGKVIKVTPPVNPQFEIRERKANPRPVIGVSGFVDRNSGRKGEQLVARLAGDLEGRAEVIASGEGWPVRCANRGLDGLLPFYNSLDVYLCSSLIEGIPMPPLEALACGVPVVIPRGVGMLDELPDILGIYRFKAGDYEEMRGAVDLALQGKPDRERLRGAVAKYTSASWVKSHVQGFEKASQRKGTSRKEKLASVSVSIDQHGGRGVYYVAYGKPARECAKGAIDSFKKHLPDIPVALVSDSPLGPEDVYIHYPDEDIGGRAAKVKIYDLAPKEWTYVCYLDSDTEIISSVDFLWRLVEDGWDLAICKNPSRFHVAREMRRSDNKDECETTFQQTGTDELIQLNGGVFCFQRNEQTRAFFASWYEEWKKYGKRDQAALLRALWKQPLKVYVLGNEWNCIIRYDAPDMAAWLLHTPMVARRWRGVVHDRSDSAEAWKKVREFERSGR